jgi:hypothetical protein
MWIFSKICGDADNASVPLLLDLWVYRKWKSFIRYPLSFVWGIGIILSLIQLQKKWLQSTLILWCGLENIYTPHLLALWKWVTVQFSCTPEMLWVLQPKMMDIVQSISHMDVLILSSWTKYKKHNIKIC